MKLVTIVTSVCLSLIFIGFLIGFLRSWKKSLIRFGILLGSLILAIFLSPVIASKLIGVFVKGNTFSGFGLSLNLEDMVAGMVGDEQFVADLLSANSTTTNLTTALANVVLNLIMFLAIFFVIWLVSLFIYWIVNLILRIREHNDEDALPVEKNAKYWWLKVLGGGIGIFSMIIICFVVMTPVFGVMNVCDKFLDTSTTTASASMPNTSSLICGELYYDEDATIGGVEGYIKKYAEIRKDYNKSFIGKTFNIFGISKLGTRTFNRLTNVTVGNLKLNVTNEAVSAIKAYNVYKDTFVANKFDITNNDSVDGILDIYDVANESEIVSGYIEELVPMLCSRWSNGEKFLGIEMPIKGQFEPLVKDVLDVFNSTNATRIEANIRAVVGVIKVANNNGVVKAVQDKTDLVAYLSNNKTFVKDAVLQLSSTNELRHAMPAIMCDFTEIVYDVVVGGEAEFEKAELTNEQIDQINWANEANLLQGISNSVLDVYNTTKDNSNSSAMADQLVNVGRIIDNSKNSMLLSKPFKVFIDGFINSSNFNLDASVKTTITDAIDAHWDDASYSFEKMFGTIQETIKVTQSIVNGNGSVNLDDLSGVLGDIIEDDNVKETIKDALASDIVTQITGSNQTTEVLTDMLDSFIDGTSKETIEKDIAAGQEIINIVDTAMNSENKELVLEGTTTEEKQEKANEILETIADSDVVMGMIANADNQAVKDVAQSITGSDAQILIDSISSNENLTPEQKAILGGLFGIVL